jgi:magnesium chelatase accessory protein
MARRLQWPRDGAGWPLADDSRMVDVDAQRWFVQRRGHGPGLLLLHGTGASAHSWRALLPRLAQRFDVLAPDLPGHGFSALPPAHGATLPGMAAAVAALLRRMQLRPALIVGHSAGVAIALRLCLDGLAAPRAVLGFNPALKPWSGAGAPFFAPLARLMASTPFVPALLAWHARSPAALARLIDGTGSKLDAEGLALYARLVGNPGHVEGALAMMANWDLHALWRDLPALKVPLRIVVGSNDRAVPPAQAREVLARIRAPAPGGLVEAPGLGHLAHEERPDWAVDQVQALADEACAAAG